MQARKDKSAGVEKSRDAKSTSSLDSGSSSTTTTRSKRRREEETVVVAVLSDEKQRPVVHKLSETQLAAQSVVGPSPEVMALSQVVGNSLLTEQADETTILNRYTLAWKDQQLRKLVEELNQFCKKLQDNLLQIANLQRTVDIGKVSRSAFQEDIGKKCILEVEAATKNFDKVNKILKQIRQINQLANQALYFSSKTDTFRPSCKKLKNDASRIVGDKQILDLIDSYQTTVTDLAKQSAIKTNLLAMLTPPRLPSKERVNFTSKSALFGLSMRDLPHSRQLFSKERENLGAKEREQAVVEEDEDLSVISARLAAVRLASSPSQPAILPRTTALPRDEKLGSEKSIRLSLANLFSLITQLRESNDKFGKDFGLMQMAVSKYNDAQWANKNLETCCAMVLDSLALVLKNLSDYQRLLKRVNAELGTVMLNQDKLPGLEQREKIRQQLLKVATTKEGIEDRVSLASVILSEILSEFQESLNEGYLIEFEAFSDEADEPIRRNILDSLDEWGQIEAADEDKPPIVDFVQAKLAEMEVISLSSLRIS